MTSKVAATPMTFERYEKKFFLTQSQYAPFFRELDDYMECGPYGYATISSLYYDTEDYSVIRRSLDKPVFKEKLRLRSYGTPSREDTVYLELKKKFRGVTYKRRIPLPLREAEQYLNRGAAPSVSGQIFGEIDWYVQHHPLRPSVLLSYDRVALFGREDPELRITFDSGIRWRTTGLDLSQGSYGAPLLPQGMRLMEVKTGGSMPCWLTELLSWHQVYPQSFSKYGAVYRDFLLTGEEIRHVG